MSAIEQIEAMADKVSSAMLEFVERGITSVNKRIDQLTAMIDAIPAGKDGRDGKDGKDAEVDHEVLSDMVAECVDQKMAAQPKPENGKDGADGKDATVDYDALKAFIAETVAKSVEALPKPKDGIDGLSIRGEDGQDGEPGRPGRDALEINILEGVDESRAYVMGTWAKHRGGLIKAMRNTEPLAGKSLAECGWSVMVDGVADFDVQYGDDLRTFAIGGETTAGKLFAKTFTLPVVIDRGVYKQGEKYIRGDGVTFGGSWFIAQCETDAKPEESPDWRLAVKRGRDGKDADYKPPKPSETLRLR